MAEAKQNPVIGRVILTLLVLVGAVGVALVVWIGLAWQHSDHAKSAAQVAVFHAITLPPGYAVTSQSVEQVPNEIGSDPKHTYEVSVPANRTRQDVISDLTIPSLGQQPTGAVDYSYTNTFGLKLRGQSSMPMVLFKPYYDQADLKPTQLVTSLEITVQ